MARKKTDTDFDVAPEGVDLGELNMTETTGYSQVVEGSFVPLTDVSDQKLKAFATRGATLPKRSTPGSAAFDLAACLKQGDEVKAMYHLGEVTLRVRGNDTLHIPAGYRVLVPTGIFMDIPNFTMVNIFARSGTSFKKGLILTNGVAIIDSDYVQELFVSITNNSGCTQTITNGERIAQFVHTHLDSFDDIVSLNVAPSPKTSRAGGFGSTGA